MCVRGTFLKKGMNIFENFTINFTVVDTIQGGAFGFLEAQKKHPRRKYFYGENELAANFHVMWFISLLLLLLLRYHLIYTSPLVVIVLRRILSLPTDIYLMNG